jgi:hypothetical protein
MFNLANLPQVKSLSTALRTIQADVGPTGTVIIKMDKTGHWVFGADQEEVEADSTWAVNPFSFVHGYIAWGDGDVLAEKMVSVSEPLPEMDDAPAGAKRGWEVQVGMSLKCLTGEDKGMEARYTTTSAGGKRGVQTLAVAIAEMVDKDPSKPVPVVLLKKEHYQHKSYGRIYTPLFDIQSWVSMDGEEPEVMPDTTPVASAVDAAPARSRRSATCLI